MLTVKTFTFNPVQENTYLLYNERGECCIIDPGCYFQEEREKLQSAVTSLSLEPVLLLNTHGHLDHVFGNKFIFETWGLVPHIHEKEQPVLDRVPASAERWGLPFDHYTGNYQYIPEDQPVFIGEERLDVLFTPGHSPGSLSFYYEPGGFIIGGDVLFDRSVGRTDLPGGDPAILLNSIQTKFFTLPDETKVYAGHGGVTTVGFEKMNNPFVKMF